MSESELRAQLIQASLELIRSGLTQGTSGNLSVRTGTGMLITPSGVPYAMLLAQDIVPVRLDGHHDHALSPSSEWQLHRDIYAARPEVQAIVHAHPTYSTTLATCHLSIPAFHYMVAVAGGADIRCADYATFGTPELSVHTLAALADRKACLLANHGMVAISENLSRAMWLAVEVETLARQYLLALQIGGPRLLSADEIARVMEKFQSYGLKPKGQA
jgi:L-fuculose-phosphate aldolase